MRKKSILVPGALILNSIPKLNKEFSIQALPSKLPIIVPGKPYTLHLNLYLAMKTWVKTSLSTSYVIQCSSYFGRACPKRTLGG